MQKDPVLNGAVQQGQGAPNNPVSSFAHPKSGVATTGGGGEPIPAYVPQASPIAAFGGRDSPLELALFTTYPILAGPGANGAVNRTGGQGSYYSSLSFDLTFEYLEFSRKIFRGWLVEV